MARAETSVTPAVLRSLEIGSIIEAGQAVPGLCKEKFCYALVKMNKDKTLFTFDVSAFEIFMFTAYAKIATNDGEARVLWEVEAL